MALGKDAAVRTCFLLSGSSLEKAIEHQAKQFFIFVDLKKGYDSVS